MCQWHCVFIELCMIIGEYQHLFALNAVSSVRSLLVVVGTCVPDSFKRAWLYSRHRCWGSLSECRSLVTEETGRRRDANSYSNGSASGCMLLDSTSNTRALVSSRTAQYTLNNLCWVYLLGYCTQVTWLSGLSIKCFTKLVCIVVVELLAVAQQVYPFLLLIHHILKIQSRQHWLQYLNRNKNMLVGKRCEHVALEPS